MILLVYFCKSLELCKDNQIKIEFGLLHSSHLNSIEIWGIIKNKMKGNVFNYLDNLKEFAKNEWESISKQTTVFEVV